MRIVFPWPDSALSSNSRANRRNIAKAKKQQRVDAYWLAKAAKIEPNPAAVLNIEYLPPNAARRDAQNMPTALKGMIDGIADAMGCDDHKFRVRYPDAFGAVTKGGAIIITIGEGQ